MKINTSQAVKIFFPNPSLELVYFEAVANSIDAGADNIEIKIYIDSFSKPETLKIEIIDNGNGFEDRNFEKFSKLLEVEEKDHKGIGRLVFLNYFKRVDVTSIYDEQQRTFVFNEKFDGDSKISKVVGQKNKTKLVFTAYTLEKIKSYDYLKPDSIKKHLLQHFYPLFYKIKLESKDLRIKIDMETKDINMDYSFFNDSKEIIASQLTDLEVITLNAEGVDLFEKLNLYYSVKESIDEQNVITAISVDNRTIPVDVLTRESTPIGYELIFLLYSNLFDGRVNNMRQELTLPESEISTIKKIFRNEVSKILKEKIPKIQEKNKETTKSLIERFPHLKGYFEEDSVGIIDRSKSLEIAQEKFFLAQKEILDTEYLSEELYQKSLDVSSRILMEYVLYRNIIIKKLQEINHNSSEADIHSIIVPMRQTFSRNNFINDIYSNNAWLLDDKYMTYSTIFSDVEMSELIKNLSIEGEEIENDDTRPDIAIIFSNDPTGDKKVDVVIVELKKLNLTLAKKEELESQLRQRARKLLVHYPNKIQRIWFYGIVDIDKELKRSLKENEYIELYSNDTVLYKDAKIIVDDEKDIRIPVGIYILSFTAFLEDAKSRNSTFLQILKEGIKQVIPN